MAHSKKILFFITFCFVAAIAVAQPLKSAGALDPYRLVNWTEQDGSPAFGNYTMIKDSKGFLWIGSTTAGGELCRFDGATSKKYFPDPQKRGAINSYNIQSFKEDSLHNIWIGTGRGISRYDIK